MTERIWLSKAVVGEVEEQYVLEALRSGWITPVGPHVDAFEAEVAERTGVPHALALSSGTAALHLLLMAAGAGPGTSVVTSSMTFAATANAIAYTGAEPVFVDAQASDANVEAALMVEAVDTLQREGRTVAAAVPVDLYGRCADLTALEQALAERGVPLIEDAAESLGASLDGRAAGSFGMGAALSFNGNKIMTTSGGGMLLTHDKALADRARYLSTQARQPVPWYEHTDIGYNYRLSNILAALGRGQLTRLDEMIEHRRALRARYVEGFAGTAFSVLAAEPDERHVDNCWLTTIVAHESLGAGVPDRVVAGVWEQGIEARHMWKPMHQQPVFAGARSFLTGTSDDLFARGINLPSGANVSFEDADTVIAAVRGVVGE